MREPFAGLILSLASTHLQGFFSRNLDVQVLVQEQEAGVWLIRTVTEIPDNERWVHEPLAAQRLQSAEGLALLGNA